MKVKSFQKKKKKIDRNEKELFLITFVLLRRSMLLDYQSLRGKIKKEKKWKEIKYSIDKRIRTR